MQEFGGNSLRIPVTDDFEDTVQVRVRVRVRVKTAGAGP
jgi:hypothetical protein